MSFIIIILAALLVFSAVIAIHEFGHFTVAKLCGIQVNEFSIGMGPVLWKKNHKGTQYSLRALPVGGFVALEGEESPESQQAEAVHTVQEQPIQMRNLNHYIKVGLHRTVFWLITRMHGEKHHWKLRSKCRIEQVCWRG